APLTIGRAAGPIAVDGRLDDAGWKGVSAVETWYETNPGDNVPPPVKNIGYLAYDDRFLYAAFEFEDPEPGKIRAPLGDRDNVPGDTDYGGIIVDPRNTGRTAIMFLANPRGIQYDAVSDDASGEDSSPDYFWDSAGRITEKGWTLEIRVPFSSLRYSKADVQTWRIMLYRNYPRNYRYQMFTSRLPRGGNCFICRTTTLNGLAGLPGGGNVVLAPYASGSRNSSATDGPGSPLRSEGAEGEVGLDVKWTPSASLAVDGTINPDFSQIESDVAQIGANERFALFFPEKRPFFLEGVELFSTPLQAVYTRAITNPRWGARATGKAGGTSFTALVADDDGGGSVILPGPQESGFADRDFSSWAAVARVRRDLGSSFVSVLATTREVDGGGHNRVVGPDFLWRPRDSHQVAGQLLLADTETPRRPDLATEWDGRSLRGHAGELWYQDSSRTWDFYTRYRDIHEEFRADNGFMPQVGYRESGGDMGRTFRPTGFLRRLRIFTTHIWFHDRDGDLLERYSSLGTGMDGPWSSFLQLRYTNHPVRVADVVLGRQRFHWVLQFTPGRRVGQVSTEGWVGEEVDFSNRRVGTGVNVIVRARIRPTDHLELQLNESRRFLDVRPGDAVSGPRERLFTAQVDRLRATYTFTPRAFVRGIVQYVQTRRDPGLFVDEVAPRSASLGASVLLAYKLNWQTVVFMGYGDDRGLDEDEDRLAPSDRQLFLKVSYAFQR
ncbi:MAG TPA: DUF5916 domain-containing protein, partial [Vicinamibacteria bacterium]|nr:DUF5916 domain-containing protein [Vicinamibacteria bacterium]